MEKLLILDSVSLLRKSYYALPIMSNDEGACVNAVYGFLDILIKLEEKYKPDYILAVFDTEAPSIRSKEYTNYKSGINSMPKELKMQIPLIKELLSLLSINIFEIDGYESSDIISKVVENAKEKDIEVYIAEAHNYNLQMVSDNVKVLEIEKGINEISIYDKPNFKEKFKIEPNQYLDSVALIGDMDLGIKGVSGAGRKTAYNLISEFKSIDGIIENIDSVLGKKLRENILESKEELKKSREVLEVIKDIDLKLDFDSIRNTKKYNEDALKQFLLKNNLKRFSISILEEENSSMEDAAGIELIDTLEKLKEVLKEQKEESHITYKVDNETSYSKIKLNKLVLINKEESYEIDCNKIFEENNKEAFNALKEYMEDESKKKIIHDAKHLITILRKEGIELKAFEFDTAIAAYIIDSSKGKYNIDMIVKDYLGEEITGDVDEVFVKSSMNMIKLTEILKEKIKEDEMDELYEKIELPLVNVLSYMECEGFKVDKEMLDTLEVKFKEEIEKTQKEIYDYAEEEFNISSPKQLGKILFEKMDLPVIKKTKTGYSTNADVLEKLKDKHPIIEKIIYYRQITKLNSTYVEGLKKVIESDGKIHSSFNQTVTTTGRLSSTEPNLQNIPIKYEMGREIRKVFIPNEEGDILLSCDYSQIELRVLAHMAEDENMINAFTHHSDIHTKTASEVFNVPIHEVTPIMRSRAKAVNFGIVYGISDFSLAQDLNISKKEASEYMNIYFDRYPKIKVYLDQIIEDAAREGYVSTIFNRRRFIPEIKASNKIVKALGERLAMNAPIQGSAADIIKIAMVNVYNRLKKENLKSSLILQVHDELILNVKADEEEKVRSLVKEEMENALKLQVPLEVDINEGTTWYAAK
ncbi:DNA polymerase I [Clostridium sp. DSM 8431]|uniref:DNA polymerase I n=1 Tax=Clostridium sp. DSM 8431 TaxID=1761781 RepID=UPI0008DF5582|nr:DNA polymerase I [Clostridium sp. DSM 8431]SFU54295.1 DNA polymerase I [Clostridium sp. DSM 8431]